MNKTYKCHSLLVGLLPFAVFAQDPFAEMGMSMEDLYGDEEFVSIATGTKKAIHKAPSVATVITADDIKKMAANNVHEIIETVTGIHAYPSKLNRMNPSYSIRGLHTDQNPQVLVLVNGVRTTYEFTGAKWNVFDVGVNLIERIEIIKGPGSAVYGADAYSGVINIITKTSDNGFENNLGAKVGSFKTKSAWLNYGQKEDDYSYTFNSQWQTTDGDPDRIVDQDLLSIMGLTDLSLAPGPLDTKHEYMDLHFDGRYKNFYTNLWYLDIEGGTGAGAAQALTDKDYTKSTQYFVQLGYKKELSDKFRIDVKGFAQKYDSETYFQIFPPGYKDGNGTLFTKGYIGVTILEDTNYGSSLTGYYTPNNEHNLRLELGFKYSEENSDELKNFGAGVLTGNEVEQDDTLVSVKGTPGIFIGDNDRQLSYLSIQDEWAFANDWELTAGVRYDNYSDFGSTINPRLALVWQTSYNLTTKFLYGSAFRAPSFGELYASNNPVLLGNPELNPEKIKTYEVAFDYRPNFDWQINVNIFKYFATDLFKYEPQTDGTVQLQNTQKQNGLGLEVDAAWEVTTSIKSKLGLALQSSEYTQGAKVADAPQKSVNWQLDWAIGNDWHLNLRNRWISDRNREVGDNRKKVSDYSISDLTALYTLNDKVEMSFSCKNLFDKKAFEPSGPRISGDYPLETRGFWLSLNYTID